MIRVTEKIPAFDTFEETLGYSSEDSLFFDIETTGLSPASSTVFLIGALCRDPEGWTLTQYLAENSSEEEQVLRAFLDISARFSTLIHFNGSAFDLPFLIHRAESLHIPQNLGAKKSVDLYRKYRSLKPILGLEHMSQASLEKYSGWERKDRLTGKHMISLFQKYAASGEPMLRDLLLLHNHDDMLGMTKLPSFAAYLMLFEGAYREIRSAVLVSSSADRAVAEISFRLLSPVPRPLSLSRSCTLAVREDQAVLRIPVFEGTLFHFFPDYRNYYYLPLEDQAVHKSVASFVDRAYRENAKASNCYIKKSGRFLPQPEELFTPAFKSSPEDPELYFSYSEELLENRKKLEQYLQALLVTFR